MAVIVALGLLALVGSVPVLVTIGSYRTRRFVLDARLRAVRRVVDTAVAVTCGVLVHTLTTTWYVTHHNGDAITVDGSSGVVQFITAGSLGTGAAIVAGVHGRRNLSAIPLLATWPALAGAWFAATWYMPLGYSPPPPELREGLPRATLVVGALTVLAGVGALVRSWELEPSGGGVGDRGAGGG